jgi:CRISPR/Cas system-associated endonuclease Cas3-HD
MLFINGENEETNRNELMESAAAENPQEIQIDLMRKQLLWMKILTGMMAALILFLVVSITSLSSKIMQTLGSFNSVLSDLEVITSDLRDTLESTDLTGMINNANGMIEDVGDNLTKSIEGIQEALKMINSIDFKSLNTAITDLQKVVSPLAKLFSGKST